MASPVLPSFPPTGRGRLVSFSSSNVLLTFAISGKSSPMMETFSPFSMVGVYETRKGLKFVHITSEKFAGKFTVLIFMDNRLDRTCATFDL